MLMRRLTGDDDPALIRRAGSIVKGAYLAIPDYPPGPEYDELLARVDERLSDSWVIGAFADGELVGCLTFVPSCEDVHSDHDDPHATSWRYFGVSPDAQGRGVGDALVRWCVTETTRLGLRRIRLHTIE